MSEDTRQHEPGDQVPLATNSLDYAITGEPQMVPGADGLPMMVGATLNARAPEGLSEENFICIQGENGRPVCSHYRAVLLDANGTTSGFVQPRQLRRYCRALASQSELMELTETNVYACSVREPPDPRSAQVMADFDARQRAAAREAAKTSDTFEV